MAIELNIKILAIQEPWVINNSNKYRFINYPSVKQLLPNYSTFRPRVLFYILKDYKVNLAPISPLDPDCIIIDLIDQNIQLINIYNASHPNIEDLLPILQRNILPELLDNKTIFLGDFNTHHPWWDPLNTQSSNSHFLLDYISKYNLSLINTIGEGTFYRPHMAIPSTIDLTFATQGIVNKIIDWQILPDLGSDHYGVLFTILSSNNSSTLPSSLSIRFNTKKAKWVLFKKNLNSEFKDFPIKDPNIKYSNQELDNLTELFTSKIVNTANSSIPKSKILLNTKPWWNKELKILRKSIFRLSRKFKALGYSLFKKELLNAKNLYFNTIKIEKLKHWNLFLEKEDTQSIYKAMSYTKEYTSQTIPSLFNSQTNTFISTFQEKSDTFRNTLFPPPPISSPINLNSYIANFFFLGLTYFLSYKLYSTASNKTGNLDNYIHF